MKFSTREDIEAPIETVFAAVTDFEHFERQAMRRGAEVARSDTMSEPGVGMMWNARVNVRGRTRDIESRLSEFEPDRAIAIESTSGGIESHFSVDLLALSKSRTRMRVTLDLKPSNFSARLFVQSLKLAKNSLNRRFSDRVAEFASDVQSRQSPI
jgi:uncharacterized protein YndB with AHSA1/START domain